MRYTHLILCVVCAAFAAGISGCGWGTSDSEASDKDAKKVVDEEIKASLNLPEDATSDKDDEKATDTAEVVKYVIVFTGYKGADAQPEGEALLLVTGDGEARLIPKAARNTWYDDSGIPMPEASEVLLPDNWEQWDSRGDMPQFAPTARGNREESREYGETEVITQGIYYLNK